MRLLLTTLLFVSVTSSSLVYADDDNKSKLEVGGRIMLDYDNFDEVFNDGESGDDFSLRRARLSVKYRLNNNWKTKFQLSYDEKNEKFEEKDLFVTYSGWKFSDVTLGKFKESFGLEYSTSSKNILTIERSMATNAFAPGRSYGVGLSSSNKKSTWALGIFDATAEDDFFNQYAVTGRATYVPYKTKDNLLHIGLSASWREGLEDRYQINENMEVYSAKKIVESANLPVDNMTNYGIEAAWQHNSLLVQGEYFSQDISVKENTGTLDADFSGYYVQASYILTGEQHRYKKGRFVNLNPQGKYGAFEFVARYSELDAKDNNRGHIANNTTLGINYYLNKETRIMFNYIHGELEGPNVQFENSGDAYSARVQYSF